ncbi:MAG: hypothetical protein M0Z94_07370 [Dehalococcoidales bacterium]|nr:hypothetical protein [Dehalococcoidales bacterium]
MTGGRQTAVEVVGQTVDQPANVALLGLFVGYGFLRSGSVLPWTLLHAFSDVVGF